MSGSSGRQLQMFSTWLRVLQDRLTTTANSTACTRITVLRLSLTAFGCKKSKQCRLLDSGPQEFQLNGAPLQKRKRKPATSIFFDSLAHASLYPRYTLAVAALGMNPDCREIISPIQQR